MDGDQSVLGARYKKRSYKHFDCFNLYENSYTSRICRRLQKEIDMSTTLHRGIHDQSGERKENASTVRFETARSKEENKSLKCADGGRNYCQVSLNTSTAVCRYHNISDTSKFDPEIFVDSGASEHIVNGIRLFDNIRKVEEITIQVLMVQC